jgi:hypothetical protein
VAAYDCSEMIDDVDILHVERIHLVGCSHIDIIDNLRLLRDD